MCDKHDEDGFIMLAGWLDLYPVDFHKQGHYEEGPPSIFTSQSWLRLATCDLRPAKLLDATTGHLLQMSKGFLCRKKVLAESLNMSPNLL